MVTPLPPAAGRWARVRPLLRGVLIFAVSLTIGRLCEVAFSQTTLTRAVAAQDRWMRSVQRLSPFGLARDYVDDFDHARRGEIVVHRVDTAALATLDRAEKAASEAHALCRLALSARDSSAIARRCAGLGVTDAMSLAIQERDARREFQNQRAPLTSAESPGSNRSIPVFLVPILALVRMATRLFTSGTGSAVVTVLQLAMGWLGLLVVRRLFAPARAADSTPSMANLLLLPIGVVVMSSAVAWVLHALMLGALNTLQWVTAFAAAAAGASGVVGFCWYCATKLSERGLEAALIRES